MTRKLTFFPRCQVRTLIHRAAHLKRLARRVLPLFLLEVTENKVGPDGQNKERQRLSLKASALCRALICRPICHSVVAKLFS